MELGRRENVKAQKYNILCKKIKKKVKKIYIVRIKIELEENNEDRYEALVDGKIL